MTDVAALKQFGAVSLSRCRLCKSFPILVCDNLGINWRKCLECIKQ
jgi:hypothetical protein